MDNASSDASVALLKEKFPGVVIIQNGANFGFAKGYNVGLKQVDADYFVLLNSDVEVARDWITPVIRLMENDPSIAACQPKIMQFHNKKKFEYAGAAGGWIDYLGYPFARGRIFDICEKDKGQYDDPAPVFWASGAAMFVRASVYRQLGGLEEYFFAHQEEIDFCWRAQLAGYSVYCCPESVVYHVGGGTMPKGNKMKVYLNFRNNLVMMARNMPAGEAIWKISWRFVLDAVSAVKSLLAGEATYFMAVFNAHIAFLGWLFKKQNKRKAVKRNRPLRGYFPKSVVWQHFILGRKKFSDIVQQKR